MTSNSAAAPCCRFPRPKHKRPCGYRPTGAQEKGGSRQAGVGMNWILPRVHWDDLQEFRKDSLPAAGRLVNPLRSDGLPRWRKLRRGYEGRAATDLPPSTETGLSRAQSGVDQRRAVIGRGPDSAGFRRPQLRHANTVIMSPASRSTARSRSMVPLHLSHVLMHARVSSAILPCYPSEVPPDLRSKDLLLIAGVGPLVPVRCAVDRNS